MVAVAGAQAPTDELHVRSLGGDDTIDASALAADAMRFIVDGGAGADTVHGGRGPTSSSRATAPTSSTAIRATTWRSSAPATTASSGTRATAATRSRARPASTRMTFNGAGVPEIFDVAANGGRVRFTRDVGNILMDLDDVERIDTAALGGADRFVANDVRGTDLTALGVALGTDGAADDVVATGSDGDDIATVTGDDGSATVTGLSVRLAVTGAEAPADRLGVPLLAGDDRLDATGLEADAIALRSDGDNGDDSCSAARAPTRCAAATATTSWSAAPATTTSRAAPGTTPSSSDVRPARSSRGARPPRSRAAAPRAPAPT